MLLDRSLEINKNSFSLFLSDAAEYMVAAGATLKSLNPKLFHTTCVADLLDNCAMKIKSYFEDVNLLIGKVKLARVNNKPDKPNSLLLIACLSLLSQNGEAG